MKHRRAIPSYLALTIITLIAGIALGATYSLTKDTIADQQKLEGERARASVMADAVFTLVEVPTDSGIDQCYSAERDGAHIGYVVQVTEKGFGGDIEIIAGVDADCRITGVSVGGSNFSETPGLGAKAKDAKFLNEFINKTSPLTVIKAGEQALDNSIDALTSATITSRSVVGGVNKILDFVKTIQPKGDEVQ